MVNLLKEATRSPEGGPYDWRSGYLDSAYSVGRRESYFEAVPVAANACRPMDGDLRGKPEYRFWFLVGEEEIPALAIEPATGRVFGADSYSVELLD